MSRKTSKIVKARKSAFVGVTKIKGDQGRDFKNDHLKHYIRYYCWMPRVQNLLRARSIKRIKYFSLCAAPALDIRLFKQTNLLNLKPPPETSVTYCECLSQEYKILQDTLENKATGFLGKLEDIATDTNHKQYGEFWNMFPFDVINLDFWGDIYRADNAIKNIFYAIYTIISRQALLRNSYELWITWRCKSDRVGLNFLKAFSDLIDDNTVKYPKFKQQFNRQYPNCDAMALREEDLVRVGFMKWLLYIANREFSVIEPNSSEILVYSRSDKDGRKYHLYNFLIRIHPYEEVTIISPACDAAKYCDRKYQTNVCLPFIKCRNIDIEFLKLGQAKKDKLRKNLANLVAEYTSERSGTSLS